jgi:hypothetical protein
LLDQTNDPVDRFNLLNFSCDQYGAGCREYSEIGLVVDPSNGLRYQANLDQFNGLRDSLVALQVTGPVKGVINGVPEFLTSIGKGYVFASALFGESVGLLDQGAFDNSITSLRNTTGRVLQYTSKYDEVGGVAGDLLSGGGYAGVVKGTFAAAGVIGRVSFTRTSVANYGDVSLFANQLPNALAAELATAKRLGIKPISPTSSNFDEIIQQGTIKYALTQKGELLVQPKFAANGTEISHATITRGKPVIVAGEADIVGNAKDGYFGTGIDTRSGHFLNGATDAQNQALDAVARKAFKQFKINF